MTYKRTPEQNKKHSLACKGKTGVWKRTPEQNHSMSESLKKSIKKVSRKGVTVNFSDSHRKNLSNALKKRWKDGTVKPYSTHGHTTNGKTTRTYHCWQSMKKRCNNPKNKDYRYYGGRGIEICERWEKSFVNFLEDMGNCEGRMTLDRVDGSKGYYKENCRWITIAEQQRNKANNVTYKGECGAVASRRLGSKNSCLVAGRIGNGWSKEKAFTTPARKINYPIKKQP